MSEKALVRVCASRPKTLLAANNFSTSSVLAITFLLD
jgi:hypothetical protein